MVQRLAATFKAITDRLLRRLPVTGPWSYGTAFREFRFKDPEHGQMIGRLVINEADVTVRHLTPEERSALRTDKGALPPERLAQVAHRAGLPLRELVATRGWKFKMKSPTGKHVERVSLEKWRQRDVDRTAVRIAWHYMPRWEYDRTKAEGRDPFGRQSGD
jgi:hypothetical protein